MTRCECENGFEGMCGPCHLHGDRRQLKIGGDECRHVRQKGISPMVWWHDVIFFVEQMMMSFAKIFPAFLCLWNGYKKVDNGWKTSSWVGCIIYSCVAAGRTVYFRMSLNNDVQGGRVAENSCVTVANLLMELWLLLFFRICSVSVW